MNEKQSNTKKLNIGKSVIVSVLDGFADKIYSMLCTGLFGRLFTSYSLFSGELTGKIIRNSKFHDKLDSVRRKVARAIENSIFCKLYTILVKYLVSVRMKVYGTILVTFFLYAAFVSLYMFITGGSIGVPIGFISNFLFALASVPLIFSNAGAYRILASSQIGKAILKLTGNRIGEYRSEVPRGRCNIAFLIGTVLGLSTFFIPVNIFGSILFYTVWSMLAFHSPEFGIVSLFFFIPFDSTVVLAVKVCVVLFSFILKFILGKRTVKFESVDIIAAIFGLMMAVGGVFSISRASYKPMLVYLCFMSVYFLTVSLMKSEEWLGRCIIAAAAAGGIVAVYGVLQYVTGSVAVVSQWLDTEMFSGIAGRVVSTFDNPNVLGEYLVMTIPLTALLFFCRYRDTSKRFSAFAVFVIMCVCLVLTWSRGAWLGMLVGGVFLLLIWNKRVLHALWVVLLAIPILPSVLPDNVIARIMSIGDLADSSTAYRLKIWLGTLKMLPERIFSGIGIGTDAWSTVYPNYALTGVDEAIHSHSLYFQIWVELGGMALVVFLVLILLFLMSNFSMYRSLGMAGDSFIARISVPINESINSVITDSPNYRNNYVENIKCAIRMNAAAPMCGVIGVLVQGFTDNVWYNYRIFLMFWMCLGLSSAYAAFGRERIISGEKHLYNESSSKAVADINIVSDSTE